LREGAAVFAAENGSAQPEERQYGDDDDDQADDIDNIVHVVSPA
jgi:hypothetical protein